MGSAERVVPVVVKVHEAGRVRTVRVGQAFVTESEVVLSLEPMTLQLETGGVGDEAKTEAKDVKVEEVAGVKGGSGPDAHTEGGRPPGSQLADLEWLAQRSRKILADPRKERWHEDMRLQLSRIEAEMERLRGRH
ncbi:MAG: hypothetical protein ACOZQL_40790 [Myxococcota bacterium]